MHTKVFEILDNIYAEIYSQYDYDQINVFLCGAEESNDSSFRDLISKQLEINTKINIVYPEWLYSNLMASKDYNLLTLEHDLAKNVDIVILPLESIGTICELGAFASSRDLISRMLVIN